LAQLFAIQLWHFAQRRNASANLMGDWIDKAGGFHKSLELCRRQITSVGVKIWI
jgi:hypothetical protein